MSSGGPGDAFEEAIEDGLAVGLVVVAGVVSLAQEHGDVFGSGVEVGAGLAGGLNRPGFVGGS